MRALVPRLRFAHAAPGLHAAGTGLSQVKAVPIKRQLLCEAQADIAGGDLFGPRNLDLINFNADSTRTFLRKGADERPFTRTNVKDIQTGERNVTAQGIDM